MVHNCETSMQGIYCNRPVSWIIGYIWFHCCNSRSQSYTLCCFACQMCFKIYFFPYFCVLFSQTGFVMHFWSLKILNLYFWLPRAFKLDFFFQLFPLLLQIWQNSRHTLLLRRKGPLMKNLICDMSFWYIWLFTV